MIIQAKELKEKAVALLVKLGETTENAEIAADIMVWADLRGMATHGTYLLELIFKRAQVKMIQLPTQTSTVKSNNGTGIIDGGNGLGQIAAFQAMKTSIEKAKKTGVAITLVRNTNNIGSLGYYSLMAAKEGMIGIAMTNAAPALAPWGGTEAFMGTNPFTVGIPTFDSNLVIADMSSSVVARGKIRAASRKKTTIPLGWALNADGEPTTDPEQALKGTLLPMGGPKGSALALIVDICAGLLSGSQYGPGVKTFHQLVGTTGTGAFTMAIKVAEFMEESRFQQLITQHLAEFKNVKKAKNVDEIFLPGEIEARKEQEALKNGVDVAPQQLDYLQEMLQELL
jgi:LDH2 family malate/lactate/ureidoglycolate dehydrogenase